MIGRLLSRATRSTRAPLLESLESRLLLTAAPAVYPLAGLPNESTLSNNPSFSDLWHIQNTGQDGGTAGADINVSGAWDLTTGSNNVVIAVLDTGIDLTNPDLAPNIWTNPNEIPGDGIDNDGDGFVDDVHGWNFVDNNNDVQDTSLTGHGTLVAGILGAVGNNGIGMTGVAQHVTMLPIKIGTDTGVTSDAVAAGINYVIKLKKAGLNVIAINASYLGFSGFGSAELSAINNAGKNGMIYVSAAGNNGLNLDFLGYSFIKQSNQIVVAATDRNDQLWSESNYGSSSVELAAPGVDITSTWNKLNAFLTTSGTSWSGPMVSGAIALLKSYVPAATATQIRSAILNSVDVLPSLQGKVKTGGRLDVTAALQTLINGTRFSGKVESASISTITGWAYDSVLATAPVPVQLVIDGVAQPLVLANVDRPDLSGQLHTTAHGFAIPLPPLGPGSHTIQVFATGDHDASKLLGAKTVVGKAPKGKLETVSPTLVKGYAWDPDSSDASINVRIDIDGVTFTTVPASDPRPELVHATHSAARGFSVDLSTLASGFHRVDVYMLDAQTGVPTLLGSKTIMVNTLPQGIVETLSALGISGYAWDPDSGDTAAQIRIDIDKNPPILITADDNRPDITGTVGSPDHGFSFAMPTLTPGSHSVKIYVVDGQTGQLVLLQKQTLKYANTPDDTMPVGKLDKANPDAITGTAYDKDNPAASILIRADIDGVTGTPAPANLFRSSLKKIGTGNHGFSIDLTTLAPGPHRVDIFMYDDPSGAPILLASKIVGTATPVGKVTTLTAALAAGWAFSPALGAAAASIRIDVDGIAGLLAPASDLLDPVPPPLTSPNHGFSEMLPHLSAGKHKIAIQIIDPLTLATVLLSSKTLTFA